MLYVRRTLCLPRDGCLTMSSSARIAFEQHVDDRQQACPHGLRGWHERCASCAIDEAVEELAACCGLCFEHCGAGCRCACHASDRRLDAQQPPVLTVSGEHDPAPPFAIGLILGMILASMAFAAGAGLP